MEIKLDLIKGLSLLWGKYFYYLIQVMEIKLDLIKGLSLYISTCFFVFNLIMEIKLDLIKGLSQKRKDVITPLNF